MDGESLDDRVQKAMRSHASEAAHRAKEIDASRTHYGDDFREDRNCLSYWYPRIARAVPTPQTFWMKLSHGEDLLKMLDGEEPLLLKTVEHFIQQAASRVGYPAFLRTGQCSGKHSWTNCCHLREDSVILHHVASLVEWSHTVDFLGLAHNVWVVRKMLDVVPLFHCRRYGNMPVVREWRYFVDGGRMLYGVPYWPANALKQGDPNIPMWRDSLKELHAEPPAFVAEMAMAAGAAVGGRWSVDCLSARDGWYVTDMAIAENSYGWDEKLATDVITFPGEATGGPVHAEHGAEASLSGLPHY